VAVSKDEKYLYVADYGQHRIYQINKKEEVKCICGLGNSGKEDGDSTVARFNSPTGVTVTHDGNLLVADMNNASIRYFSCLFIDL
jgi:sugar lactone lactonase YvrE